MGRWLRALGVGAALAATLPGCMAHARGEVVYDYPVVTVEAAPARVETYPRTYYHGSPAYLVDGRWYYRSGPRWVYFREEPVELRNYRVRHYDGPRRGERYSDVVADRRADRYRDGRRAERYREDRRAAQRAEQRRAEERRRAEQHRAAERRAEQRRQEERRAAEHRAAERRAAEHRAAEHRAAERRLEERRAEQRRDDRKGRVAEKRPRDNRRRDRDRDRDDDRRND